jgi:hypothetical protein
LKLALEDGKIYIGQSISAMMNEMGGDLPFGVPVVVATDGQVPFLAREA